MGTLQEYERVPCQLEACWGGGCAGTATGYARCRPVNIKQIQNISLARAADISHISILTLIFYKNSSEIRKKNRLAGI